MRLFLIRHAETVDNVAGVYAGVTDSALTNHGVLQANRLGQHLAATDVKIAHIFSSNLVRAFKTAEAIRVAQAKPIDKTTPFAKETVQLALLREQDFGSLERKPFSERPRDPKRIGRESYPGAQTNILGFKDVEPKEAMRERAALFIDQHITPLLNTVHGDHAVIVVAHGIILIHLCRGILRRFAPAAVSVGPGAQGADRGFSLEHLAGWSNTGYLDLEIKPTPKPKPEPKADRREEATSSGSSANMALPAPSEMNPGPAVQGMPSLKEIAKPDFLNMSLVVKAVNSLEHLKGLKKTGGGIGSSAHDEGQKSIESFFKKRKIG